MKVDEQEGANFKTTMRSEFMMFWTTFLDTGLGNQASVLAGGGEECSHMKPLLIAQGCVFYKETVGFALGLAKFAAGTNFTRLAKRETDDGFTEN